MAKNCGSCGHDCTALPFVNSSAAGIECRNGVCYIPPAACLPDHAHCSARADDGCEASLLDHDTCGGCASKCTGTALMCVATTTGAQCVSSCPTSAPNTCGNSCVNLASDPQNCGTCGHDCRALQNVVAGAAGVTCQAGACMVPASACAPGYAHCSSRPDDGCETALSSPSNCGTCGKVCSAPTALCSSSGASYACSSSCVAPAANLCGNKCVDFNSDPTNCGACNHDCTALPNVKPGASGVECRAGACYVPPSACAAGYGHCSSRPDDGCESSLATSAHCGSCSLTCGGSTPICSLQTQPTSCLPSCGGSTPMLCGSQCVNLTNDANNCGACGHSCASLPHVKPNATSPAVQCVSGACVIQPAGCVSGYGHCSSKPDDGCETDLTRPQTCGSCTNSCASPLGLCSTTTGAPVCASSCTAPTPNLCGSKCVDTKTDPTNCGTCGHDCTALPHLKPGAAVTCDGSGGCVVPQSACATGYANCSSGAADADGCETATNTLSNCGGCGISCSQPNATATCASGTCSIVSCSSGYGDCTSAAGCETPLNTASHCGSCTTSCSGGAGLCGANNQCVACGGSGQPCCPGNACSAAGTSCMGGTCKECNDGDSRACGECGNTQTCSGGSWQPCASCCPVSVKDGWTTTLDAGPWGLAWGDPSVDTTNKQLILSFDDIAQRNPNYPGGYVVSFYVNIPSAPFVAHLDVSGFTNATFPAFRRASQNTPLTIGGMRYAGSWGSFGAWNGQQSAGGSARVTIYVKANTAMAALATSTGFSAQSGWVTLVSGAGATGNLGLVGTNDSDLASSDKTAAIGPINGCAGLSDGQVDALYTAKKEY
ncbi:MAG TPA: hypothetical protein VHO67_22380 [Polyangia bacterium]|nr:hypothetical protein [Polyangia bacterium]